MSKAWVSDIWTYSDKETKALPENCVSGGHKKSDKCNCRVEMRMGERRTDKPQHNVQFISGSLKSEAIAKYFKHLDCQLEEELKTYEIKTAARRKEAEKHDRWEFERYLGEGQHPYTWVGMHQ